MPQKIQRHPVETRESHPQILRKTHFLKGAISAGWPFEAVESDKNTARIGRLTNCVAAGVFTGLAWWTKYNGWLPLAVGLAAIGLLVVVPASRRKTLSRLLSWLVIALIAAALFIPVWISLLPTGGYGSVAANHAKYVVGLDGWPTSAEQQLANLALFDGWASVLAPVVGLGLAVCLSAGEVRATRAAHAGMAVVASIYVVAAGALLGSFAVAACLALGGCGWYFLRRQSIDSSGAILVSVVVCLVWMVGLLVSTPLYTPYARLTVPLLAATWLGAGLAVRLVAQQGVLIQSTLSRRAFEIPFVAGAVILLGPILWQGGRLFERGVPAWQDHSGLRTVAAQATKDLGALASGNGPVFLVYGEPALFHHLRAFRAPALVIDDLRFAAGNPQKQPRAAYLAVGPHARRDPRFAADWEKFSEQFELADTYNYVTSDVVLLDSHHPRQLRSRPKHDERIEFFLWHPRDSNAATDAP